MHSRLDEFIHDLINPAHAGPSLEAGGAHPDNGVWNRNSSSRTLREFPFFLGRFMTQVEHDISDFEEAGEAVPGGVPERQWHHHVEDDEL